MVKVLVFDWAFQCKEFLHKLGCYHKKIEVWESEEMMFRRANIFLNNGMSIMIEKSNDPNIDYTLFVDVQGRRFKQR